MNTTNLFSEKLKELRFSNNLSQVELGKAVGLSKQTINDIEHNRSKTTLDRAMVIADYFEVSLDYLVGRSDEPNSHK